MKRLFLLGSVALVAAGAVIWRATTADAAYNQAFEPTPPGEIEVKTLPAATLIRSESKGSYFDRSNGLFMPLFRYIQKRDIAMTTPVEAEIEPGEMAFYIGPDGLKQELTNDPGVSVELVEERLVLSVGLRGSYSEENYDKALAKAQAWLKENPDYEASGDARMIYWNGPYVPSMFKKSELHLPVTQVKQPSPAKT